MFDRIVLNKPAHDGLSGSQWTFCLLGTRLVVDRYHEWEKATRRHQPKILREWSRLDRRGNRLSQEQVPFTEDIAVEAKETLVRLIQEQVRCTTDRQPVM